MGGRTSPKIDHGVVFSMGDQRSPIFWIAALRGIIYPRPKIVMKQVYMKATELKINVLSSIFNFQSI